MTAGLPTVQEETLSGLQLSCLFWFHATCCCGHQGQSGHNTESQVHASCMLLHLRTLTALGRWAPLKAAASWWHGSRACLTHSTGRKRLHCEAGMLTDWRRWQCCGSWPGKAATTATMAIASEQMAIWSCHGQGSGSLGLFSVVCVCVCAADDAMCVMREARDGVVRLD